MPQNDHILQIAKTRLTPPRHNEHFITRTELLDTLRHLSDEKQVTTVVAPPGYGKTALVADLVHHVLERQHLWLSLSEADHDPVHFIASLSAVLQQLDERISTDANELMRSRSKDSEDRQRIMWALDVLTNEILEQVETNFWLILEDYHRLNEGIRQAISKWLEKLPAMMHLIIISRHDLAFSRLRIQRQLGEITTDNLRFSPLEVHTYLQKTLDYTPDDDIVTRLHEYLQGWAAGLSLIGLLLEQQANYPQSIDDLNLMLTDSRDIYAYFAEEVLAEMPDHVRQFLLDTSLLNMLRPEQSAAVSQQTNAGKILDNLYQKNLFIRITGNAPVTYQYHDLFKDFLQHKLQTDAPDRLQNLHRRAVQSAREPEQAIYHAIEGELWEAATEHILSVASLYWQRGWIMRLEEWILLLPATARDQYPPLLYWLGLCAFQRNRMTFAQQRLEYAMEIAQQADDMKTYSSSLEMLVNTHMILGNYEQCVALIPDDIDSVIGAPSRAGLYLNRMWLHLLDGHLDDAHDDLQSAANILNRNSDPVTLVRFGFYIQLPIVQLPNGVEVLKQFCQQVQVHIDDVPTMLKLSFYELAGFLDFWQGKPDTALKSCETALDIRQRMANYPYLGLDSAVTKAMIHTTRKEFDHAHKALTVANEIEPDLNSPRAMIDRYLFPCARILWQADDINGMYDILNHMTDIGKDHLAHALIEAMIAISSERWQVAETHLDHAQAIEETRLAPLLMQHTSTVLRAYRHHLRSQPEKVISELEPILKIARTRGTPGLLLKEGQMMRPLLRAVINQTEDASYAEYVLELMQSETPSASRNVQLTDRELDVLNLIATGATNGAIAEALFISIETVKTHVSNILEKFDATTRTEAVSIGYASGILQG